jgi:hypothetical protein
MLVAACPQALQAQDRHGHLPHERAVEATAAVFASFPASATDAAGSGGGDGGGSEGRGAVRATAMSIECTH